MDFGQRRYFTFDVPSQGSPKSSVDTLTLQLLSLLHLEIRDGFRISLIGSGSVFLMSTHDVRSKRAKQKVIALHVKWIRCVKSWREVKMSLFAGRQVDNWNTGIEIEQAAR